MNEEELKKGCGKETIAYSHMDCNDNDVYFRCGQFNLDKGIIEYCEICQARLEGFQKGKLEQKKEELEFLYSLKTREDGNKVCINYTIIMNKIKQLQKEIGEEKGK